MQVPVGSTPLAKSRLRRQHSRRLSRFAPGPGATAQENEELLPRQRQQPSGSRTSGTSETAARKRSGEKPAAADERLPVEVRKNATPTCVHGSVKTCQFLTTSLWLYGSDVAFLKAVQSLAFMDLSRHMQKCRANHWIR